MNRKVKNNSHESYLFLSFLIYIYVQLSPLFTEVKFRLIKL